MFPGKCHHIGVAVPDIAKAVAWYQACFGYKVLSGPFDDPLQHVSVCFLGGGEDDPLPLELVAPLNGKSPVDNALAKNIGAYHVCYEVDDLEKSLAWAQQNGCLIVVRPLPAVAFAQRKIVWLFTPTRQLIELVEQQ
jgi:methylmalonyl-CoA/ethylmalonyl-CoA epimerase